MSHDNDRPGTGRPSAVARPDVIAAVLDPLMLLRWLDVVLLVVATPFALALGVPAVGLLTAVVAWTAQRVVAVTLENQARATEDIRRAVGLQAAGVIGRGWGVALSILVVGLAVDRADGAAAAATVIVAFTVHLAGQIILRATEPKPQRP